MATTTRNHGASAEQRGHTGARGLRRAGSAGALIESGDLIRGRSRALGSVCAASARDLFNWKRRCEFGAQVFQRFERVVNL